VAPTVLTFTDDAIFPTADYINLGFTHFEASAVGAAGGRGGDSTTSFLYVTEGVKKPVPQSVWDLVREQAMYEDWFEQVVY
ncbi:UNVERIFIED_CONTAM: hypothetical protein NY603_38275, partial [Bacteroidetes bacterium 56_B9]